jgi:beta-alanine--pyruvate transaminase
VELAPIAGEPGKRGFQVFLDCWEHGVLVRNTGDTIALSPPLIIEKQHIEHIVGTLAGAIARAA